VTRLSLASLPYAARSPTKALSMLKAHVDPMSEPIDERRAGVLNLTLENQGEQDLAEVSIKTDFPAFLDVVPGHIDVGALRPGTIRVFSFTVSESKAKRPYSGAPPPIFNVAARAAGESAAGVITVTAPVPISVLGLSDALKLVQLPSFLFVPGALLLLTCNVIWRLRARNKGLEFPLSFPKPEFWVASVIISVIAAMIYPWLTRHLGEERDYLVSFTIMDVLLVSCASILVALPVYFIAAGIRWYVDKRRRDAEELARRAREIGPDDGPVEVLRKLAALGGALNGMLLSAVTIGTGKETQTVLDSGISASPGERWVLPNAIIKLIDRSQAAPVDTALDAAGDLAGVQALVALLNRLGVSDQAKWDTSGPLITRPRAWPEANIASAGGTNVLLERV